MIFRSIVNSDLSLPTPRYYGQPDNMDGSYCKSPAKINYRPLTEINSCYYGLWLLRTLTRGPKGVSNKGVDYTPIFLFQLVEIEFTVPCTQNFNLYFVVFLRHDISFFLLYLSVSMHGVIGQFCISLYNPLKLQPVSFPVRPFNLKDIINISLTLFSWSLP